MGSRGLTPTAALEARCAARFGRRHAVALGRGTWAIALFLRAIGARVRSRILALPSFLCQTPLAGLLHEGWEPLFVDVDPETGLVPEAEWERALALGAGALMPVHLFGNAADLSALSERCRAEGVFVIEDTCQAVGASSGGRPCGAQGDAAVLSFGPTKILDAGSGGMLLTDDAGVAAQARDYAAREPYLPPERYAAGEREAVRQFYERKDRLLDAADPARVLAGAADPWLALVPAAWNADAGEILRQFEGLEPAVAERRRKWSLYASLLSGLAIEPLRMVPGAAPWRFCFRAAGIGRARQLALSEALRRRGLHVSNWYLPTHWMAPQPCRATGELPGTLQLHAEIFQLWLDPATDDARIRANAAVFREAIGA